MKLTKEQTTKLKQLSDAIYKLTQGYASIGQSISNILQNLEDENQLRIELLDPNIAAETVIRYVFDKDLYGTFEQGTDNELKMMDEAYNNTKFVPTLGTEFAAAYDLRAYLPPDNYNKVGTFVLYPMATKIISTNLKVEVPIGYELVINPRSGLASKGITISNSPGTIDADYRGVVGIILYNNSGEPFIITHGDRIAQCKLKKLEPTSWCKVDELSETARGTGGFGHTGLK